MIVPIRILSYLDVTSTDTSQHPHEADSGLPSLDTGNGLPSLEGIVASGDRRRNIVGIRDILVVAHVGLVWGL
jgi:hypothetical protein